MAAHRVGGRQARHPVAEGMAPGGPVSKAERFPGQAPRQSVPETGSAARLRLHKVPLCDINGTTVLLHGGGTRCLDSLPAARLRGTNRISKAISGKRSICFSSQGASLSSRAVLDVVYGKRTACEREEDNMIIQAESVFRKKQKSHHNPLQSKELSVIIVSGV